METTKNGTVPIAQVGTEGGDLISTVTSILNGIIGVMGLVCVVVMIIGGVNYMTSAGDASKVKKGKDTILYGLIGLAICALAFMIVNFVIINIIGAGSSKGDSSGATSTAYRIVAQIANYLS